MALRVTTATTEVGAQNDLSIARGEDREFRLTFTSSGVPYDFTDASTVLLGVKNPADGAEIFTRSLSGYVSGATGGTPIFRVYQADTENVPEGPYDVDVVVVDTTGYKTQLQLSSKFSVLRRVTAPGDAVTTPPAVPVVYGLTWHAGMWSTPTGGYNLNDAVAAYDGSLGATAISSFRATNQGVTYYPISATGTLATGWAYIARPG